MAHDLLLIKQQYQMTRHDKLVWIPRETLLAKRDESPLTNQTPPAGLPQSLHLFAHPQPILSGQRP